MEPVLIYRDKQKIAAEKRLLDHLVSWYQEIYDSFRAIKVELSFEEILKVVSIERQRNKEDAKANFVLEKLSGLAGDFSYNGVILRQDKLKELIHLPDLSDINVILGKMHIAGHDSKTLNRSYFLLEDGKFKKSDTAESEIEAVYTYYTKTDKSTQLANDLQNICNALNKFDRDYNFFFGDHLMSYQRRPFDTQNSAAHFSGLAYVDDKWCISLQFIRNFELTGDMKKGI